MAHFMGHKTRRDGYCVDYHVREWQIYCHQDCKTSSSNLAKSWLTGSSMRFFAFIVMGKTLLWSSYWKNINKTGQWVIKQSVTLSTSVEKSLMLLTIKRNRNRITSWKQVNTYLNCQACQNHLFSCLENIAERQFSWFVHKVQKHEYCYILWELLL